MIIANNSISCLQYKTGRQKQLNDEGVEQVKSLWVIQMISSMGQGVGFGVIWHDHMTLVNMI